MAEIVIRKYTCDVCKKEFDKSDDIQKVFVPCRGQGNMCTTTKIDLCSDCRVQLVKVVWDGFAEIVDDYGVIVQKKKF